MILLAVSLAIFGILRIYMPKTYENELTANITANTHALARQLETAPQDQWEDLLIAFCIENNTGVSVYDGSEEWNFSYSVYTATDNTVRPIEKASYTSVSAPFERDGKTYSVTAQVNARAVEQVTGIFTKVFPAVLVIILLISALTAFFYARFLAKPIVNISNISKRMTALDMAWRCDVTRTDEIGVLAGNLNEMAERLDGALRELQTANLKLQADIDREREQEKRRRDFFSAISHELKTPVTILKGELDGMILNVGKFKDRDKYLWEAMQTTESIEELVREILTLAKLETLALNPEPVIIPELADECLRMYEGFAQGKRIQINTQYDGDHPVHADNEQLRAALSNIIGNAVKHSPEGGTVDVRISKTDGRIELSVENSGVHIEEPERVWEPFYRADKSRSRDTGGSGLGLYIVRTILDNHGFEYRLENTPSGVRFSILFTQM